MEASKSPSSSFSSSLHLARTLTSQAHGHLSLSPEKALPLYLQSAQLYSLLVRQANTYGLSNQIKKEWAAVLSLARNTKEVVEKRDGPGGVRTNVGKWKRCDQKQQALVIYKSSDLETSEGTLHLPEWKLPPSPSMFTKSTIYTDPYRPSIPPYLEATYALPPDCSAFDILWDHSIRPEMIVQSHVRNCSLVAGIQAAIGWNNRFGGSDKKNLLASILYPMSSAGLPVRSASGRYILRLTINGLPRSLSIDGELLYSERDQEPIGISLLSSKPSSPSVSEVGSSNDRARGMEYALGLIEKGWMKLTGGWDSKGSNSSVDLAGLTGWIPEVIRFQEQNFQRENVWRKLMDGFAKGTCLMTLGTGSLSSSVERSTGLISRHDYAITDLIERDGEQFVQIVNPWNRPGDGLTLDSFLDAGAGNLPSSVEALTIIPEGSEEEEKDGNALSEEARDSSGKDRLFVVPWETVITTFNALYLNWDPRIFYSNCAVHSAWSKQEKRSSMESLTSPMIILDFQAQGTDQPEIWLLLTRHRSTIDADANSSRDGKESVSEGERRIDGESRGREWIGLDCMEDDTRATTFRTVSIDDISSSRVELTDSTHVLLKILPTRAKSRHMVFVHREGSTDETRFTLEAFSNGLVNLSDGPDNLRYSRVVREEFSARSAGGNVRFPTFMNNPMFKLVVDPPSEYDRYKGWDKDGRNEVRLVLKGGRGEIWEGSGQNIGPMNVKLVWGKGERVFSLVQADIVGDSGPYREKTAICHIPSIAPGVYTVIVSLYSPQWLGKFELGVLSSFRTELSLIPQEGAGMFTRSVRGEWAPSEVNPVYKLLLEQPGSIFLRLQPVALSTTEPSVVTSPVRLSVCTTGPGATTLTTSGAYTDEISGAVTPKIELDRGEYDVVISGYGGTCPRGRYILMAYGDKKFELG